jgi:hypothetical protein
MKTLHLEYCGHISIITGRVTEAICTDVKTIRELIFELDKTYSGMKEIFFTKNELFNIKTLIFLRRIGKTPGSIFDPETILEDGDTLFFL